MNPMQQAQKLMAKMQEMQDMLEKKQITGESGAGMIKIIVNGKNVVQKISIDPSLKDDIEILEDLLVAAFNDAQRKVEECVAEESGKMSMGLPKIPGLPF